MEDDEFQFYNSSADEVSKIGEWDFETVFQLWGYETESDREAHLCCSECGEPVELVSRDCGPGIAGGVCGCAETPDRWTIEEL